MNGDPTVVPIEISILNKIMHHAKELQALANLVISEVEEAIDKDEEVVK
jgi:hypothetical protein